jgi:Uma2 family endonuclease
MTPAPGTEHQRAVGHLFRLLAEHVERHALGEVFVSPTDCILSDATVVQPDILSVEAERVALISRRGIEGPPGLVVEVVSPTTAGIDRGIKRQLYARHGVPFYWIVDLASQRLEAYGLSGDAFGLLAALDAGAVGALPPFPGLRISVPGAWM